LKVLIEGQTPDELLELPEGELDALVLTGKPVAFRAGTAEILGQFEVVDGRLVVELAHIDGGGEGVLPTLRLVARRLARRRGYTGVEWVVHATRCAQPNPKLLRALERSGFQIREVPGKGACYHRIEPGEATGTE
jgi:hypothetical protein